MDQADIPALLARLASDEDAARKMAVFKLQSSINDPAFADVFISSGGLVLLRRLIMTAGGNTLAYSLQSLTRLLEVDMGWDIFEGPAAGDLVERIVELIVTNPLVNILRGAMSILVALVGRSQSSSWGTAAGGPEGAASTGLAPRTPTTAVRTPPGTFGFRALKPAVAVYPQFFELVIQQLQSADHALCANALMLVNALIRDAVSSDGSGSGSGGSSVVPPRSPGASANAGEEWSKFIKRLQDLGLIRAVYNLLQSSALQDLAHPLLEFQSLTKVLLRKWREVRVDLERPEHRRALKGLHLASAPDRRHANGVAGTATAAAEDGDAARKGSRRHNPEKWRRLGFETESPAVEFETAGFLGMMDLTDYVRKNEDGFQKLLLEQSTRPLNERCPVARASLAVTMIVYDHFEVDKSDLEDIRGYLALNDAKTHDKLFRPLLLQWSRLHTAGLHAFFRLWKSTGAQRDDFDKVAELVRVLIEQVVGQSGRTKDVLEVEDELQEYDAARLRELQMELLELSFEDQWGPHLFQVRDELKHEALQFVKEQRIRCLLQGSWFTKPMPHTRQESYTKRRLYQPWRFAKLSHNRRYLHYADFPEKLPYDPGLDALVEKIDLGTISSVVSNVSASPEVDAPETEADYSSNSSTPTLRHNGATITTKPTTKITIYSFADDMAAAAAPGTSSMPPITPDTTTIISTPGGGASSSAAAEAREQPVLTLYPLNHSLASEWLDGLLMLLSQAPITAETNKLVALVSEYGLKIRLLNVRLEQMYAGPNVGRGSGVGVVPGREGLDEEYFYEI
ncbi:ELMO/CED-12 family-domain-containing protein [Parachaetomium inaequale]|uniref:ELMO/CED-12 family-domain-containing protein n=1 Tax=Parachaetomium inaequale TaxID=2588326 RepID=A0AAN6PKF5_9PEZI|nr:ELMO/CED-12 family-domain-containing protein [Parachaetomium inaequale]